MFAISDQMLQILAAEVRAAIIEKRMLGWDLDELEYAAEEALERDPDSDDEEEDQVNSMTPGLL